MEKPKRLLIAGIKKAPSRFDVWGYEPLFSRIYKAPASWISNRRYLVK
jgi:hypothetical protein